MVVKKLMNGHVAFLAAGSVNKSKWGHRTRGCRPQPLALCAVMQELLLIQEASQLFDSTTPLLNPEKMILDAPALVLEKSEVMQLPIKETQVRSAVMFVGQHEVIDSLHIDLK